MDKLLEFYGGKQVVVAHAIGCTASQVSRVVTGRCKFSLRMAHHIEKLTGGVVTKADIRPDVWGKS